MLTPKIDISFVLLLLLLLFYPEYGSANRFPKEFVYLFLNDWHKTT
jgi:hypothetical protein